MSKIYQKKTLDGKTRQKRHFGGFTLVELLVVVLIIGILAAVALPTYKMAVAKARATEVLPLLDAIRKAQELYYMSNGQYSSNWEALGVEMGGITNVHDCISGGLDSQCFNFNGYSCSIRSSGGTAYCEGGKSVIARIGVNFVHGVNRQTFGDKTCITPSTNEWGNKVCQALGGRLIQEGSSNYYGF